MKKLLTVLFALTPILVFAQIETPEVKSVLAPSYDFWFWNGLVPEGGASISSKGIANLSFITVQATATGTGGFLYRRSDWGAKWGGAVSVNTVGSLPFFNMEGFDGSVPITNGKYYTFNVPSNPTWDGNNQIAILETSGNPVSLTAVAHNPDPPTSVDAVTVEVTLSGSKSAEESIFVRYTTNGWTSSSIVLATGSGTSYSAVIPVQSEGTTVNYYALSSTVNAVTLAANPDLLTLNANTNGGVNYSYVVGPAVNPPSGTVGNASYTDPTSLTGDLNVTGTLTVNATVNTGSNTIDLGASGTLSETLTEYVIGNVTTNPALSGGAPVDINGLGITINPNGNNLGSTTVTRRTGTAVMGVGLDRQWTITPTTPPGSSVDVTITWPSSDDNGLNLSDLYVYRSEDNGVTWIIHAGPLSTGSNPRSLSFTTTTFSDWTVGDGDTPLPIKLLSWTATAGDKKVTLNWETASELNHAGFEVYRSAREKSDFRLVSSYTSSSDLRGKGDQGGKYSLVDKQVLNTVTYYYKLVDVSLDGKRIEHDVLSVIPTDGKPVQPGFEFPIEFEISSLYPNPFNPTTNLIFDLPKDGLVSIRLFNVIGQEVKVIRNEIMKKGRDHVQTITSDGMPSGVYMVVVEFGGQRLTKKLTFLK